MRSSRSRVIQDCELLAEGEDLKVKGYPASNGSSQAMEQGNEYGSHAANAMPVRAETSMDSGTDGLFNRDSPPVVCACGRAYSSRPGCVKIKDL